MRAQRPKPALLVALLALFVALGGTGYAAISVSGKNVKNRSLTAKDIRKNTLGGTEIKEPKLAKVPSARVADNVATVRSAATANGLNGPAAGGFLGAQRVTTTGLVKMPKTGSSIATSPARTLFKRGPFTVSARCYDAGGGDPKFTVSWESSELGSTVAGDKQNSATMTKTAAAFDHEITLVPMTAPSGAHTTVVTDVMLKALGSDCAFAVHALSSP